MENDMNAYNEPNTGVQRPADQIAEDHNIAKMCRVYVQRIAELNQLLDAEIRVSKERKSIAEKLEQRADAAEKVVEKQQHWLAVYASELRGVRDHGKGENWNDHIDGIFATREAEYEAATKGGANDGK